MQHEQTIVALASMFFGAKLKGLCEQAGYSYNGAIGPSGVVKRIEESSPIVVLLDLGKEDIEIETTVALIKEKTNVPIIAFCGHVATKELELARECGCDVVTTNGAITGSFDSILSKALELP
jgi:AmiR/NasT family two-component response regulator